ncbi:D-alanyl-D-alanine carboxypeptidase/D-alanyl-D-alanine-endopeptidase [Phytohabitans sp. ZYX-F-186]|uniref:D-alanyl-D-alanine carboxypeptidase/D-alanyl-D-alanine-endopeptidase n=1 Tax=Phytohabitans maris TaxID=3071409 RepID=A0ABU0ZIY8_9ACTN|nr:D-alanyl-D-alanine carboxypeptidase/D-alanyl-D-alanine-endopeptidase [Phytohabitans sp. ZYX-F-186]MDQ7906923.1 D-alanyl-D-alanine carboxypeptidase/D-alanyl-D-alanine-endopeptidase [Phytohabitans sp. ZYX-F-186]
MAPPPPAQQPPERKRRRGLAAVIVVVLLLAGLVAGAAIVRPGPVDDWLGGDASDPTPTQAAVETPEPPPAPVLVASTDDAPEPTAAGVKAALDPVVAAAGLGGSLNISVVDVATGDQLYARGPEVPTVPASTTKLVTAAAVLAARGPAYRIPTRVVAGANPGEVVIIGGGDATLSAGATGTYPGAARLDLLAKQVKAALGGTAPTRVIVDSTLFPGPALEPSWDADVPTGGFGAATTALMTNGARVNPKITHGYAERYPQPDLAAGQAFARALGLKASAVTRGTAPADVPVAAGTPSAEATQPAAGAAPEPGTELGKVESPPILRLVEIMLVDSDNVVAESLARQVALAKDQPASYAGGAAATKAVLADLGLPAAEITLADGSGLSRKNHLTPTILTDVLRLAAGGEHPELAGLMAGLPVAAWSGTLRERYRSPAADNRVGAGVVRAKTGTLGGVNAISGVVTTADGRLLAFAVLADKVPVGKDRAESGLDKIATTLAGCGCST